MRKCGWDLGFEEIKGDTEGGALRDPGLWVLSSEYSKPGTGASPPAQRSEPYRQQSWGCVSGCRTDHCDRAPCQRVKLYVSLSERLLWAAELRGQSVHSFLCVLGLLRSSKVSVFLVARSLYLLDFFLHGDVNSVLISETRPLPY
jgi:hypothetical protein